LVGCLDLQEDDNKDNYMDNTEANIPIPKLRAFFSNKGFTTFLGISFLTANGAGATFLPTPFFPCKTTQLLALLLNDENFF
jgi:hypothetical protein